jgi:hypothetical protein
MQQNTLGKAIHQVENNQSESNKRKKSVPFSVHVVAVNAAPNISKEYCEKVFRNEQSAP